jgi:hypothetical protein
VGSELGGADAVRRIAGDAVVVPSAAWICDDPKAVATAESGIGLGTRARQREIARHGVVICELYGSSLSDKLGICPTEAARSA